MDQTFQLGIIGNPISHSLSPAMHTFWLSELGLPGDYIPHFVEPHQLSDILSRCKTQNYQGLNVTIPHKQAITPLLDHIDDTAQAIGAVNTILFNPDNTLSGANTDAYGFTESITPKHWAHWTQPDGHVVVLGNGGASRAILYALCQQHVPHITIMARDLNKSQALFEHFTPHATESSLKIIDFTSDIQTPSHGIISTLPPKGFAQLDKTTLYALASIGTPQTHVIDIAYQPHKLTPCQQWASQHNLSHQNGLAMLVHQGAASFTQWTDHEIYTALLTKTFKYLHTC